MRKYLKLYKKWVKTGYIQDGPMAKGSGGLCNSEISNEVEELFDPHKDGIETKNFIYWGVDSPPSFLSKEVQYGFNSFRQNVVLLLAAINNEL